MDPTADFTDDEDAPSRPSKRQRTGHHGEESRLSHDRYTIAWVCALHIEMAAAIAMLDTVHLELPTHANDNNSYTLGSIKNHNIVVACLPLDQYGTNNAANVLTNMRRTFPSIRRGLMVGVGGGAPSKVDIRLGDIVVGTRVMQYDFGKVPPGGGPHRTAVPKIPDYSLRTAVTRLRAIHELEPSQVPTILWERMESYPGYHHPGTLDRLFQSTYAHQEPMPDCRSCDESRVQARDTRRLQDPIIHYGAIASSNQVMKDAITRDAITRELDVICFEMEAAGLMDILPCLPIRGICDYSDSHKAKEWQRYAAATAAAYARCLLQVLPADEVETTALPPLDLPSGALARRELLLKSLKFERIDERKINIKAAHFKTCHWFLKHQGYLDWLDSETRRLHCGFLWIRGKPGAGKSIIMKFIYSNMKKKDRRSKCLTTSFFFHARGNILEKTVSGMYRSLLLQILEGFPKLQEVLDDVELVPRDHTSCPSVNALKDLLRNAVLLLKKEYLTCFVDALDECDEQQVKDMVEFFEELAEQCTQCGIQFRICFSSRHYPYIDVRSGIRLTLEDQVGHAEDLNNYIDNRLHLGDPALLLEVKEVMLQKAAGVFLWVALVVDILNTENGRGRLALRKRLAEVPSGLSDLFKDLLTRDHENTEELRLSILLILYAARPLKPDEYYHALWIGLMLKGWADAKMPDANPTDAAECFSRCVISSSKGLAEVTRSDEQTVQFIHESVRDFLIKDNGLQSLWPELGADCESRSHESLKVCCHAYLLHEEVVEFVSKQTTDEPGSRYRIAKQCPLLEYASCSILYHANAAAEVVPQEHFLDNFPTSIWVGCFNHFEPNALRRYPQDIDIMYVLADRGHPALIRARLEGETNITERGVRYRSPLKAAVSRAHKDSVIALLDLGSGYLGGDTQGSGGTNLYAEPGPELRDAMHLACQKGYLEIAQLLLKRGVNPLEADLLAAFEKNRFETIHWLNGKGVTLDYKADRCRSMLSRAVMKRHTRVAELLLHNGVHINAEGRDGLALLTQALYSGFTTLATMLIKRGAPISSQDEEGRTPLCCAVTVRKNEPVVILLLDEGAHIDGMGMGRTPLIIAIRYKCTPIVRLLLDRGADIEFKGPTHYTPLLHAVLRNYAPIVRLLLERGANTECKDIEGQTPLLRATTDKRGLVARLLLNNGADIESKDRNGRTPLSVAIINEDGPMVRLLLEKGADIESRDNLDRTPLLLAILRKCEPIVLLLLESGADIDHKHTSGLPLLSLAIRCVNGPMVRLLLEKGADIESRDSGGRTPLLLASTIPDETIAGLLLEKGADVESCDDGGRTPLYWAIRAGCVRPILRLLLENGADVNSENKKGVTPLSLAVQLEDESILQLLKSYGEAQGPNNNDGPVD